MKKYLLVMLLTMPILIGCQLLNNRKPQEESGTFCQGCVWDLLNNRFLKELDSLESAVHKHLKSNPPPIKTQHRMLILYAIGICDSKRARNLDVNKEKCLATKRDLLAPELCNVQKYPDLDKEKCLDDLHNKFKFKTQREFILNNPVD